MLYQDNMPNPIPRARMELQLLQDFFNAMVPPDPAYSGVAGLTAGAVKR